MMSEQSEAGGTIIHLIYAILHLNHPIIPSLCLILAKTDKLFQKLCRNKLVHPYVHMVHLNNNSQDLKIIEQSLRPKTRRLSH